MTDHQNRRAFDAGQARWDNACPPDDDEGDSDYCTCDLEPTIEEGDWGKCDCCGKELP